MKFRDAVLLCGLLSIVTARSALAVDPSRHISQYAHSTWRIEDGLLGGTPREIAQTRDGYIWIGTENGLLRFDGVRFVPWTPPAGQQLPSPAISSLLGARDGSLWIGTPLGLSHWTHGHLVNYTEDGGFLSLIEDPHGTVWVSRYRAMNASAGSICQIVDRGMRCYGKTEGLSLFGDPVLVSDGGDGFWIGGGRDLTHWTPGASVPDVLTVPTDHHTVDGVRSRQSADLGLAVTTGGSVWVGGRLVGLQQLVNGSWKPFVAPDLDSRALNVNTLLLDREQALWVATYQGLYRIHDHTVDRFVEKDGLSSDSVQNVFEDRDGNLWVATTEGLDCFRDVRVSTWSTREGLVTGEVNAVLASRDGTLWIAGVDVLSALRQNRMSSIRRDQGLPGSTVTTVFEDHAGRLWVGVDRALYIFEHGTFTSVNRRDGRPLGLVVGMTEDVDGNIWAEVSRTPRTLVRIRDRAVQEEFPEPQVPAARKIAADPHGGIWLGLMTGDLARYRSGHLETFHVAHPTESFVRQLAVTHDGSVIGAAQFGLIGLRDGHTQTLTARNGLPCDSVNAFVEDARGALWLYMQCALVEISRTEMAKWWANPKVFLQVRVLDAADGVRPSFAPFQGAARTLDGRLWFANNYSLQMLNPALLDDDALPPPVTVEQVVADRARYSPNEGLRIPPLVRDLEIDYTAMSFGAPQKVRFRYQLEGRDSEWQDVGTRRQAFYTDLRPGRYRFRVAARNSDGVWSDDSAILDFRVLPAWYQTIQCQALAVLTGLLAMWTVHQLRLRQLAARFNVGLEARVLERTRIARELHDTLLQSFHSVLVHFQAATNLLPDRPAEVKQRFEGVIDQAARAITEGRDAVHNLRSSTVVTNDLAQAVSVLGDALVSGDPVTTAVVRVNVEGTPRHLHPLVRDDVYRIIAEAVRNAVRHAEAHLIQVDIQYGDRHLRARVHDDGKGIDPSVAHRERSGHWGLSGMRERATLIGGRLDVRSQSGSGTEVDLSIPASSAYTVSTRGHRRWPFSREVRAAS